MAVLRNGLQFSRLCSFNKTRLLAELTVTRYKLFHSNNRLCFLSGSIDGRNDVILTKYVRDNKDKLFFQCSSSLQTESAEKGLIKEPDEYVQSIYDGLKNHDRGSLARAITLIETSNPAKKVQAKELLNLILHDQKANEVHSLKGPKTFRVGKVFFFSVKLFFDMSHPFFMKLF